MECRLNVSDVSTPIIPFDELEFMTLTDGVSLERQRRVDANHSRHPFDELEFMTLTDRESLERQRRVHPYHSPASETRDSG